MNRHWRKSRYSKANGNCAEVGQGDRVILVRDTKQPRPVLKLSPDDWRSFISGVKEDRAPGA
jgi:Domain of unknown function (DUF397)